MAASDFIAACHDVIRERRTGVLEVEAEGIRTVLSFRAGMLVFAEAGGLSETLGRILVRQEILTGEQYSKILERMTEGLIKSEQARFGEVAIQLGFLSPEQVNEALRVQVRRKFLACLQWESSTCEFFEGEEEIAGLPPYPTPFEPIVVEGVRQFFDEERCAAVLAPVASLYPALRQDAETVATRHQLDARGLRLLRALDGTRTFTMLLEAAPAGPDTRALLVALVVSNALRVTFAPADRPEPAPESATREESVVAILPAPPSSVPVSPTPPGPAPPPTPPPRISHPPPAPLDARVSRLEAETAYQTGCRLLAQEEWSAAARELRRATTLFAEPLEYALAADWAELRAGAGGTDWPARRASLRRTADRAVAQDRTLALGHHVIGHLASLAGDVDLARRSLEAALAIDPNIVDAQRTLRLLQRRASAAAKPAAGAGRQRKQGRRQGDDEVSKVLAHIEVARSSGAFDEAIQLLRRALAANADVPALEAELALCLLLADPRRNAREANALARKARQGDGQLALPWVVAGMLLEPLGEKARAAQLYRHAIGLDPECAEAQAGLERVGV